MLYSAHLQESTLFGRKQILIYTAILSALSFLTLAFSRELYLYYIARFFGGICVGIFLLVVPIYVAEITNDDDKFKYLTKLFIVCGNLFCFVVGPYVTIQSFTLLCMIPSVFFLIFAIILIPESPYFLVKNAKYEEAKAAIRAFNPIDAENRLIQMKTSTDKILSVKDIIGTKHFIKILGISLALTIIQQLTAFGAILLYMHHIFHDANSSLSKEMATILMGVVQVLACLSSHIFFEKFERKPLELISTIATCLSLFILSIYFYLIIKINTTVIAWVPIASLIVYIFFCTVGMEPLPTSVLGDTFPLNLKQIISVVTATCCFIFSFIVAKIFPILVDLVDNCFAFLIFGVLSGIGIIFIWINMPKAVTIDNQRNEVFEIE